MDNIPNPEDNYYNCREHFHDDPYVNVNLWGNDFCHLKIVIRGKENTPFDKGYFVFEIKINRNPIRVKTPSSTPPRLRFKKEDLTSEKSVRDFKKDLLKSYGLNHFLGIQLIFKGKVLPDNLKLNQIGFHPEKDVLTVMAIMASPPYTQLWKYGKSYCVTLIWHPNVDSSIPPERQNFHLGRKWNPNVDLNTFIEGLKKLIHLDPDILDLEYPLNKEAADEYLNNRSLFNEKAMRWTIRYATRNLI